MRTRDCIKWLWRASDGVRERVMSCAVVGGLQVGVSMAFVWSCKELIDKATSSNKDGLAIYIGLMVVCLLLQILCSAVEQHIVNLSETILKNKLRHSLFTRLMESRWYGKEALHTGDTLNRVMEDVRVTAEAITNSVPTIFTAGIQFIAAFIFLFILAPGLAWAIPGIMLAMLIISKSYVKRMRRLTKEIRTTESTMQSLMQESLQHRLVINTLEMTPHISNNLAEHLADLKEQVMNKTGYSIFTRTFIQAGFSAGYAVAFLWGVFGIMSGAATFGMMTAFLQLVGQIQRPIMNLTRQIPPLINSITAAERLAEIEIQPSEKSGEPSNLGKNIGIRFENVDYSYPNGSRKIINKYSHDFKPGSTTALIGETGAGKSTMMMLMLALLEPDKGQVIIYNDETSQPVSPQTRCNIVYVPQENILMSGTIRDNLLLGDPTASDSQLEKVLYLAAADFVMNLPDGLDTLCGERGSGLSKGQVQRIVIARSLLRKGGILLLDEPTSALDPQTEVTLISRLKANLNERTLIIVTHRETTAALCKNVLILHS